MAALPFLVMCIAMTRLEAFPLPIFGTFANYVPELRSVRGLSLFAGVSPEDTPLATAIAQFSGQLVKLSMGVDVPTSSQVDEVVQAFSNLIAHTPNIEKALNISIFGEEEIKEIFDGTYRIHGVTINHSDNLMERFMKHMAKCAEDYKNGRPVPNPEMVFLPYEKLPLRLRSKPMKDRRLPYLNDKDSELIRGYYENHVIPKTLGKRHVNGSTAPKTLGGHETITPGYDINNLDNGVMGEKKKPDSTEHVKIALVGVFLLAFITVTMLAYFFSKRRTEDAEEQVFHHADLTPAFTSTPKVSRKDVSHEE
ncbi:hypothetical protein L596_001577 [Steinernema carpocapsae]|uniref:Uncharacterized protein n=1 Tax=Steinernema carpocapsae TaxID=34508 RepID=A0A4U8UQK7_STECR|nr:hypothetical protein L596_001577 [Steinernema carpocapsae]